MPPDKSLHQIAVEQRALCLVLCAGRAQHVFAGMLDDMRPFVQERDYTGQPDEEWATEAWHNYRENNDSVIVDHFQVHNP